MTLRTFKSSSSLFSVLRSLATLLHLLKRWQRRRSEESETRTRPWSLGSVLSYCLCAEPPLNVSGDLLSAHCAVYVCFPTSHSGGTVNMSELICSRSARGCVWGFCTSQEDFVFFFLPATPSSQTEWDKEPFQPRASLPSLSSRSYRRLLVLARPLSRTTGDGSNEFISVQQSVNTNDITNKIKDFIWAWARRAAGVGRPYKRRQTEPSRTSRTSWEGSGWEEHRSVWTGCQEEWGGTTTHRSTP